MWKKIGLNCQEEWVEENPQGLRRVETAHGYITEPSPSSIRWGRVGSSADALTVAQALSHAHIFQSYDNLDAAFSVWTSPHGKPMVMKKCPQDFRTLIEFTMASRIWDAARYQRWSSSLPAWEAALSRPGPMGWSFGVDLGLLARLPHLQKFSLEQYKAWAQKEVASSTLVVSMSPTSAKVIIEKKIYLSHPNIPNCPAHSLSQWAGNQPKMEPSEAWESQYRPFSNVLHEGSGFVSPLLNQALRRAHPSLPAERIREDVSSWLGCDVGDLGTLLSDDQVDAVWLAYQQLKQGKSFLLADETGYGKGRILAALSKIALNQNIQILFFTEKKALLSDFYRDCNVLFSGSCPDPAVLHSTAKVFSQEGKSVFSKQQYRAPQKGDAWTWTTYSQFNRANPEKLAGLLSWMKSKKTWMLMDEAQNAAGSSNTAKTLKKMQSASSGIVFSSATYAKNEDQLSAYRHLFDGDAQQWRRLISAFVADSDTLRTAITLMWAERGVFLRREHPPMALPEPKWIGAQPDKVEQIANFSNWWSDMLACSRLWSSALHRQEGPWARIGAHLSRASREFSLLQKKDFVLDEICHAVSNGKKPVIVADWTLSSHVSRMVAAHKESQNPEESSNGDEEDVEIKSDIRFESMPLWKNGWEKIVMDVFPDEDIRKVSGPQSSEMKKMRNQVLAKLQALPDWSVSPFDDLLQSLRAKGISFAELSGRSWELVNDDGWVIRPRPKSDRSVLVQNFNAGHYEGILLTRAGNSGLSLHAGKNFTDQRQRHLMEWDVSPDPSVRLQFWGRVRRKDQIMEPLRSTILMDTPFERRRQHRDMEKQKKILSHSGSTDASDQTSWIGHQGSFVAKEWVRSHPTAEKMLDPWPDANIEKIMARSVVLDQQSQEDLMEHLNQGVSLLDGWSPPRLPQWNEASRVVRRRWWYGAGQHALHWEERVWRARPAPTKEVIFEELSRHTQGASQSASQVIEEWKKLWQQWWIQHPHEKTSMRAQMLQWWTSNHHVFERGQGLEVNDPHSGERACAIILGWHAPDTSNPRHWSASQISLVAWINTMEHPIELSLSAWMSPQYASARPIGAAKPSWFGQTLRPTQSMVLVGAPWSACAWGARHNPKGSLIHLHDEMSRWTWGWKMPSAWDWSHMLITDRELSGVDHALAFIKAHPQSSVCWRWTPSYIIDATPQAGGLMLSGKPSSLELLAFNILQKCGRLTWNHDRTQWFTLLPWKEVRFVLSSWSSSGAIPTVSYQFSGWVDKTWGAYDGKP